MDVSELEFQGIYDAFYARIFRYLSRLVGDHEAEDLCQEVFLKVGQGLNSFRGEAQLSTWIYRIATNTAIDRLRTPAFRQDGLTDDLDEERLGTTCAAERAPEVVAAPDQEVMRKEMYDCFGNFVKGLPSTYRAVVILSELEELPNQEIAEILGLSLDVVKMRLHRGRALLFDGLKAHCKAEDWL
jgi:RNA polymerase sigma-70 factor (ECF subfamily)